jgi:hypothetical protein
MRTVCLRTIRPLASSKRSYSIHAPSSGAAAPSPAVSYEASIALRASSQTRATIGPVSGLTRQSLLALTFTALSVRRQAMHCQARMRTRAVTRTRSRRQHHGRDGACGTPAIDDTVTLRCDFTRGQDQRRGLVDSSHSGDALKNKSHPSVASALQQILCSAPCRNRTYNLVIKSHLLCQLS